jgi:oligopeptide transport system substrate-binding protein
MTKRLVALFGAAVIVLAACGPGATTAPAGSGVPQGSGPAATGGTGALAAEQTLRQYLSDTDPPRMNPALAQDSVSISVISAIHRGLLYFDDKLGTVPALAEAMPEVSDGGTKLTFKLRDAKYADGDTIVAGDIVRQLKRLLDPRNAGPYAYIACDIKGANALIGADTGCAGPVPTAPTDAAVIDGLLEDLGVAAPDDKTFVVTLERPATYFTTIMAMWVAVPVKEEWTKFAESADLGASGPFQVTSWSHNAEMVLEPNPNWYGQKPTLTRIEFAIGGDYQAALASYEQGDLDTVTIADPANYRQVEEDPDLSPMMKDVAQMASTYYTYANCGAGDAACPAQTGTANGKSATANKNFRIALTQAINKQTFNDLTFGGIGQIAASMVMPGIPGYDPDYNPYQYDPDAAKAAMSKAMVELGVKDTAGAEAGGPDGVVDWHDAVGLGPMKFGYNCNAGHLPRVAFIAEAWRTTFGLTEGQFDISCTDFATLLEERQQGKYHMARDGWSADFPHAKNQLDLFVCGGGNNDSQYCNPAFDDLFGKAATETDPAKQEQMYKDAQRIVVDDAAVLFLRWGTTRYLIQPYVSGVIATPSDHQNVGDVFYENMSILEHD